MPCSHTKITQTRAHTHTATLLSKEVKACLQVINAGTATVGCKVHGGVVDIRGKQDWRMAMGSVAFGPGTHPGK